MALSWLVSFYFHGILSFQKLFTDRELANLWIEHYSDRGYRTEIRTLGK